MQGDGSGGAGSTGATEDRGFPERGRHSCGEHRGTGGEEKELASRSFFFVGDLWESRREAEEQIGKEKEALGWLEEQWGYCVCLKTTTTRQNLT